MPDIRRISSAGERAYAYAKACGIIGRSFIGKRVRSLENIGRLSELDRMVFPDSSENLPEKELLPDLEKRITRRSVESIITIVECFSNVPELFSLLVRSYEYADLKGALIAALEKEASPPAHTDIGRFQTVRFGAWPDIKAMIGGTEFDFLLDKKSVLNEERGSLLLQTTLDRRYYNALWKALSSLRGNDRRAAEKILADEISLKNSVWALRLRVYYRMPPDKVEPHLIDIPVKSRRQKGARHLARSLARSLSDEAIISLGFPLDSFASWSSWRWKDFLNTESGETHWQADPRHFQNASSRYLFHLAKHHFRLHPFSLDTVFCFIKLKQFEEDILTSHAEGLGMGMSGRDILSVLGVES
jgi:vacuolar-type H+-ATPase subunit C/Vma6